jgi:predicted ATPase
VPGGSISPPFPAKELVIPAIAHAAELTPASGEPAEELARAIRRAARCFSCSTIASTSPVTPRTYVRSLLAGAPAVRVLATSQELLKVHGEFAYALDGLAVADADAAPDIARACAALQLLERRARAADARYRLAGCQPCAGARALPPPRTAMALAIEMAAARLPVMGIEMLLSRHRRAAPYPAQRGSQRRGALSARCRDTGMERHRCFPPTEKSVLARLSFFVGAFRLEAARQVASLGDLGEWEVHDSISALRRQVPPPGRACGPPRYRLLETMRLFGTELLAADGELEAAVRGHAAAMTALAEGDPGEL